MVERMAKVWLQEGDAAVGRRGRGQQGERGSPRLSHDEERCVFVSRWFKFFCWFPQSFFWPLPVAAASRKSSDIPRRTRLCGTGWVPNKSGRGMPGLIFVSCLRGRIRIRGEQELLGFVPRSSKRESAQTTFNQHFGMQTKQNKWTKALGPERRRHFMPHEKSRREWGRMPARYFTRGKRALRWWWSFHGVSSFVIPIDDLVSMCKQSNQPSVILTIALSPRRRFPSPSRSTTTQSRRRRLRPSRALPRQTPGRGTPFRIRRGGCTGGSGVYPFLLLRLGGKI